MDFKEIGLINLARDGGHWPSYGHDNEHSGSVKGNGSFDQLNDC
jgi:hypothetical protein